jgi:ABC-type Na+ efflux pump permease subunit
MEHAIVYVGFIPAALVVYSALRLGKDSLPTQQRRHISQIVVMGFIFIVMMLSLFLINFFDNFLN